MLDLSSANDTRVHRPREMEGRQGIVQWEGRKKEETEREERMEVEEETLRPVSRLSYCLSSFFHLCCEDLVPFGNKRTFIITVRGYRVT